MAALRGSRLAASEGLRNVSPVVMEAPRVRLAEVVALLSLGTDLGLGQPMEHMIRACLIALRLADRLGLEESERGVVYYAGLLAWVAYEQAKWFGDDLSTKRDARYEYDVGRPTQAVAFMLNLADVVEVFQRTRGVDAALAVARERSGTQFDPAAAPMPPRPTWTPWSVSSTSPSRCARCSR